jgi:hypothetical protein
MYYSEFKLRIDSLLESKNYWLKNNVLNLMKELLNLKNLTDQQKKELSLIYNEALLIEDGSFKKELKPIPELQLKDLVIKISKIFEL